MCYSETLSHWFSNSPHLLRIGDIYGLFRFFRCNVTRQSFQPSRRSHVILLISRRRTIAVSADFMCYKAIIILIDITFTVSFSIIGTLEPPLSPFPQALPRLRQEFAIHAFAETIFPASVSLRYYSYI